MVRHLLHVHALQARVEASKQESELEAQSCLRSVLLMPQTARYAPSNISQQIAHLVQPILLPLPVCVHAQRCCDSQQEGSPYGSAHRQPNGGLTGCGGRSSVPQHLV